MSHTAISEVVVNPALDATLVSPKPIMVVGPTSGVSQIPSEVTRDEEQELMR